MKLHKSIKAAIESGYTVEGRPQFSKNWYKIKMEGETAVYEDEDAFPENNHVLLLEEIRVFVPMSLSEFIKGLEIHK